MDASHLWQLIRDGRFAEAEVTALAQVESGVRSPDTFSALATAARQLGHFETTVSAMRQAAALRPDDPDSWFRLGEDLCLTARWTEAFRAYRTAADLAPHEINPLLALAGAQLASQRVEDASATASLLMRRFPTAPESLVFLAHLERTLGRHAPALAAYRQALDLDPGNATALLGLAELDVPASFPAIETRIRDAFAAVERPLDHQAQLRFALGRLLERESRFDEAFPQFENANALHRRSLAARGISCERDRLAAWLRTARERYPAPAPVSRSAGTSAAGGDFLPIFVVGLPRSGTTLVEQILARHPDVAPGGELTAASVVHAEFVRARARAGLRWPVDPSHAGDARLLADARERYVELALGSAGGARHLTDKHPGNAALVGFLRHLFPGAPVVRVSRDPVATCWSIYASYLPGSSACFTSFEDIACYHAAHEAVMRHWAATCDPAPVDVRYESLIAAPEKQIRALLSAVGLEWHDDCLTPEGARNPVTTASVDQVRRPIHGDSVGRHLRYAAFLAPLRSAIESASGTAPQ